MIWRRLRHRRVGAGAAAAVVGAAPDAPCAENRQEGVDIYYSALASWMAATGTGDGAHRSS